MVYMSVFRGPHESAQPAVDMAIEDFFEHGGLQGHNVTWVVRSGGNDVILTKFSSLTSQMVVILKTSGANHVKFRPKK